MDSTSNTLAVKVNGQGSGAADALIIAAREAGLTEAQMRQIIEEERRQALAGIDYRPPRVSIEPRTQQFSFLATGELRKELDVVVVFSHKARGYWEEGNKVPVCSSLDGKHGTGNPGGACIACPLNQFESDPKGGRGKACKEMRRLYFVSDEDVLPQLLTLPPTSITAWDEYVAGVVGQQDTPSTIFLRTRLSLEKQEDKARGYTWSVLKPAQGEKLPIPQVLKLRELRMQLEIAAAKFGIEAEDYGVEAIDVQTAPASAEDDEEDLPF